MYAVRTGADCELYAVIHDAGDSFFCAEFLQRPYFVEKGRVIQLLFAYLQHGRTAVQYCRDDLAQGVRCREPSAVSHGIEPQCLPHFIFCKSHNDSPVRKSSSSVFP